MCPAAPDPLTFQRNTILRRFGCVVVDRWSSDISEFLLTDPILYAHRKRIHVVKQFISNDISATKIRLHPAAPPCPGLLISC